MYSYGAGLGDEGDKALAKLLAGLRKLADDLDHGTMPRDSTLAWAVEQSKMEIGELWRSLGMIARRLESLAHKQLRRVPLSDDEARFVRSYGANLAGVMLYAGNSYLTPNDDAPRVVDVYANPNTSQFLEVGICRPRAIYVLYPFQGGEVLCRGAVMPYYEFTHRARLTDAQWKSLLDSPSRPKPPPWVSPIIAPGGLSSPLLKPGH